MITINYQLHIINYQLHIMRYSILYSFFILLILLESCGADKNKQQAPPPPPSVGVYEVHTGSTTYYDLFPANIIAVNQVDIRAQVNGAITGIYFKEGQEVTK